MIQGLKGHGKEHEFHSKHDRKVSDGVEQRSNVI